VIFHWDASPSHVVFVAVSLSVQIGCHPLMHNGSLEGRVPSPVVGDLSHLTVEGACSSQRSAWK
jgi:hypothetical protein